MCEEAAVNGAQATGHSCKWCPSHRHVPVALGPKSVSLRSWNLRGQLKAIIVLPGCEMVAKVTSGFSIPSF